MAQWFPLKPAKIKCACEADVTETSTVREPIRGFVTGSTLNGAPVQWVKTRSRMIRHHRARDDAWFWHWEDQHDRLIGVN